MEHSRTKHYIFIGFIIIVGILLILSIIFLKKASDKPTSPIKTSFNTSEDSLASLKNAPVAIPDTSVDETVRPVVETAPTIPQIDSMAKDTRPPYEVGLNDGYETAKEDIANNTLHENYDESCSYEKEQDIADYVKGYRAGYQKAIDENKSHNEHSGDN